MTTWWRRLWPDRNDAELDTWSPPLGVGYWRMWYGECCDALLAVDRAIAALPYGGLRDGVSALRAQLPPALDRARELSELGARLDPAGPVRDPRVPELLAEDPVDDLSRRLGEIPTTRLMAEVLTVRDSLRRAADEIAALAARIGGRPVTGDTTGWLDGLAESVATARRAGWSPCAPAETGALTGRLPEPVPSATLPTADDGVSDDE